MIQDWWIFSFLQPVYERWLRNAMLTGALKLRNVDPRAYSNVLWVPRGWDWVDPKNDLEATEIELRLGGTSLTDVVSAKGGDLAAIVERRKAEKKLFEDADLPLPSYLQPAPGAAAPPAGGQSDDHDEPEDDDDQAGSNGDGKRNGNGRTRRSINNRLTSATR